MRSEFCQQVAIVQRLFHQLGGGGAQVVHVFRRQIETGRDIQYLVPQPGWRKVFEIQADEREIDVFILLVFVPLIDKGPEAAQRLLRMLVDRDIHDGGNNIAEAGYGRAFIQIAADFVLGIDVDDDNMADFVLFDFMRQNFFRIHFRHIQKAAHAQIVGQAAVYQVDVGAVFAVAVFLETLKKFFSGLQLSFTGFAVGDKLQRRRVLAMAAVVIERNRCEHHRHGA